MPDSGRYGRLRFVSGVVSVHPARANKGQCSLTGQRDRRPAFPVTWPGCWHRVRCCDGGSAANVTLSAYLSVGCGIPSSMWPPWGDGAERGRQAVCGGKQASSDRGSAQTDRKMFEARHNMDAPTTTSADNGTSGVAAGAAGSRRTSRRNRPRAASRRRPRGPRATAWPRCAPSAGPRRAPTPRRGNEYPRPTRPSPTPDEPTPEPRRRSAATRAPLTAATPTATPPTPGPCLPTPLMPTLPAPTPAMPVPLMPGPPIPGPLTPDLLLSGRPRRRP